MATQVRTRFLILLILVLLAPRLSAQESDAASLSRENESLRSEVDTLKKHIRLLEDEITRLKSQAREPIKATANKSKDEGELIGIVWDMEVLKPDGSVLTTGKFFAANGKLYKDNLQVGTYTENGSRAKLDITKNVGERALGTAELLRVSNKPPTYQGRFTNKRGESPVVRLRQFID